MICTAIYFQDENLASRVVRCVAFAWLQHRRSKLFSIRSLNRLVRAARPGIRCIFLFSCPSKRKPYRLATHLRVYDRQRCARLANLETCSSGSPVRDESGEEQNKDSDRTRYFRVLLVMQLPGTIPSFLTPALVHLFSKDTYKWSLVRWEAINESRECMFRFGITLLSQLHKPKQPGHCAF